MAHWSEQYLGWQAEGERPCWMLLRKVWMEQAGFVLPTYEGEANGLRVMDREAAKFELVPIGEEQELDAVYMNTDVNVGGKWMEVEGHIGVCVAQGLVLHVERGMAALIDPIKSLRVTRIMKGPRRHAC